MRISRSVALSVLLALYGTNVAAWNDPDTRNRAAGIAVDGAGATQGGEWNQPLPQEVKRVSLSIKGTDSREWSRYGFTDAEVVRAITERLARAGIEVVPAAARDIPILEIDAHVNDQTVNNSYIVYVRLKDRLTLPQNPDSFVTRTVWSDWKLGGFEPHNYRKLRAAILELVDTFANQHLLTR